MSAGAETARLFTLGHSNLSAEAFIGLLAMHGVTMVFDVRSAPYSARFPHFKKKILKVLCEEHGMQYSHVPQLGGQDPGGVVVKMKEPKGVEALQNLAAAAAGTRFFWGGRGVPCILCAESDYQDCHRKEISEELELVWSVSVAHIRSDGSLVQHSVSDDCAPPPPLPPLPPFLPRVPLFVWAAILQLPMPRRTKSLRQGIMQPHIASMGLLQVRQ